MSLPSPLRIAPSLRLSGLLAFRVVRWTLVHDRWAQAMGFDSQILWAKGSRLETQEAPQNRGLADNFSMGSVMPIPVVHEEGVGTARASFARTVASESQHDSVLSGPVQVPTNRRRHGPRADTHRG
jgi:hypothetical protein